MKKSLFLSVACAALALCGVAADARKVAAFARNESGKPEMDELVASVRERLAATFAEEGFKVVEAKLGDDDLKSPTNAVRKAGCDLLAVAAIRSGELTQGEDGGVLKNNYSLSLSLQVLDAKGEVVDGIPSWTGRDSLVGAGPTPVEAFRQILENWASEVSVFVMTKIQK